MAWFMTLMLGLPRIAKRGVVLMLDAGLCVFTVWLAYYLRLGEFVVLSEGTFWPIAVSICLALSIFTFSGLYRFIFRYSGSIDLVLIARVSGVYGLLYSSIFTMIGVQGVPRTIGLIQPILLLVSIVGSRVLAGAWLDNKHPNINNSQHTVKRNVLIYGVGSAGLQMAASIAGSNDINLIGFIDDDTRLRGGIINGKVIYSPLELPNLVKRHAVREVYLTIPGISRTDRNAILSRMQTLCVATRTLPTFKELTQGAFTLSDLSDLDVDDLIGRDSVAPNDLLMRANIQGKVVLVTGAGGSIGSELCRQILRLNPFVLLLVERSEYSLYAIHQKLEQELSGREIRLLPLLACVRDGNRVDEIIGTWHPDTVYHAAAYKHVPLVEHNLLEGIKNNVFGTLRVCEASLKYGVRNFVLVSTDKAVRPSNLMGASKRLAEMLLQAMATIESTTKFSMVRFGNVLDSSGSVVPKFKEQIRTGGPVTLTHEDITRYFMTITEAAELVIQAGAMAEGGDVFVLDMGHPIKIKDLAQRMIALSGKTLRDDRNPDGEIAIEVVGLRPGEKLYEELLIGNSPQATLHPKIMRAQEAFTPWLDLQRVLNTLQSAVDRSDFVAAKTLMEGLVTGYTPDSQTVDWVYLERQC
jgi:FlaA1/EpsC-like NDP-sugar epimerase